MKKYLLLLITFYSIENYAQKAKIQETEVSYRGKTYKVGDIIQLAYGSTNNKDFAFVNYGKSIGNVNLPGLYKNADMNWSKAEVEVVKIYMINGVVWARCNPLNREANYLNKQIYINIEGAIDNNEIGSVSKNKHTASNTSQTNIETTTPDKRPGLAKNAPAPPAGGVDDTDDKKKTIEKNNNVKIPGPKNERANNTPISQPGKQGVGATNGKLYFRTMMWTSSYGSSLDISWIFLGNNGMIVRNPKHGVNPINIDAELKNNKDNVGAYKIAGNKLNISWQNGKTASWSIEYSNGDLSAIDAGLVTRPEAMPSNYKLSGQYSAGAILPNVSTVQTLVFNNNGTFTLNQLGAVHTNDVSAMSEGDSNGTYHIGGNTLRLKFANGRTEIATILIWDMGGGKKQLVINKSSFKQER